MPLIDMKWSKCIVQCILHWDNDSSRTHMVVCKTYIYAHNLFCFQSFSSMGSRSHSVMKLVLMLFVASQQVQRAKKCQKQQWRHVTVIPKHMSTVGDIQNHILAPRLVTEWTSHLSRMRSMISTVFTELAETRVHHHMFWISIIFTGA